jgi:hypothetical protein
LLGIALLLALFVAGPATSSASAAQTLRDGPYPTPKSDELDPDELTGAAGGGGPVATTAKNALERAALKKLSEAKPGDLWSVADGVAMLVNAKWDKKVGAYRKGIAIRTRANAEMLIAHSNALLAGHKGAVNQPQRIAPLVKLLTGKAWVPHATDGASSSCYGSVECWHARGFIDIGTRKTMHRSRDAVIMRALAAAWQARKAAHLPSYLVNRIRRVVTLTARDGFWRTPHRLQNQVNWTSDVMGAYTTVTGSSTLIKREYHRQWAWFLSHARRTAYSGGTSNLSAGLGFHYVATRPSSYELNGEDTVEYANIVYSGLKYYDAARSHGMAHLSKGESNMLWHWTRHLTNGNWTVAGYPNWDTGHGAGRIHLTQYWLLSLRGMAMGLVGTAKEHLVPNQVNVARGLVRNAVALYQRRALAARTVALGPSAYGFYGSTLLGGDFDSLTGTARMASMMSEFSRAGLGSGPTKRLPSGYSHDRDFGRLAITTSKYSSAILGPWRGMKSGGAEPARLLDTDARVLTNIGGGYGGTLGLRVSLDNALLLDTQPGVSGQGATRVRVPRSMYDHSGPLGKHGVSVTTGAAANRIAVGLRHHFTENGISTRYVIHNNRGRTLDAVLRVPTYGQKHGGTFSHSPSVEALKKGITVTGPVGGSFGLRFTGLPKGTVAKVTSVQGEQSNPRPGPELLVKFKLRAGSTTIRREIFPK